MQLCISFLYTVDVAQLGIGETATNSHFALYVLTLQGASQKAKESNARFLRSASSLRKAIAGEVLP
jgi:hypothetical protein